MILELDCGNSLIKWRLLRGDTVVESGVAAASQAVLQALAAINVDGLVGVRMVSVRSEQETRTLTALLREILSVDINVVRASAELAGVTSGYLEPKHLGADRWMAIVAGFHLVQGACLVLDLGTAVTADFVDVEGRHLGGYIAPGISMMRDRLSTHTKRVGYADPEGCAGLNNVVPGASTATAVNAGCLLMLRGFAQAQLLIASEYFGDDYSVIVTGGDAPLLEAVLPLGRIVPDLVFQGLRFACPLGGN